MGHCQAGPHQKLCNEVAVSNSPEAILSNGKESQFFCKKFSVNNERVAGQCAAAERQDRNSRNKLTKAVEVIA